MKHSFLIFLSTTRRLAGLFFPNTLVKLVLKNSPKLLLLLFFCGLGMSPSVFYDKHVNFQAHNSLFQTHRSRVKTLVIHTKEKAFYARHADICIFVSYIMELYGYMYLKAQQNQHLVRFFSW